MKNSITSNKRQSQQKTQLKNIHNKNNARIISSFKVLLLKANRECKNKRKNNKNYYQPLFKKKNQVLRQFKSTLILFSFKTFKFY